MRDRPSLVAFAILVCGVGILAATAVWVHFHTWYPTPETESAFLKNYTPKNVIEQFEEGGEGSSYSNHKSGGAGGESVAHSAGFEWHFAMCSDRWMSLMDALQDDVRSQLVGSGAQILGRSGDARDGFHFEYKLGNSVGTLTILPLRIDSAIHRAMPLRPGLVDTDARIEQTETWFPKPPGLMVVRVDDKR